VNLIRRLLESDRDGRSYAVTLLTPITDGQGCALAETLQNLGLTGPSPLSNLPYVHFGRWVMIDDLKTDWPGAPKPTPRLLSQYLLFSASVTAPEGKRYTLESFLRELYEKMEQDANAIWSHCLKYPSPPSSDAFVSYLRRSSVKAGLFYACYADTTVDEIRGALALRDNFTRFARDHQRTTDAAALRRAYLEESSTWPAST
jgi:hypothetical protein